jgi:hypothetical protein
MQQVNLLLDPRDVLQPVLVVLGEQIGELLTRRTHRSFYFRG